MKYNIKTPTRKQHIKKLTRRSYTSFASSLLKSDVTTNKVLVELARKMKREMKSFSSDKFDSILRDKYDALHQFSWESIFLEMSKGLPTLVTLLVQIIPKPSSNKQLVCMVASQLLKARHRNMCLIQRAISIMLYGNGTKKQVSHDSQYYV